MAALKSKKKETPGTKVVKKWNVMVYMAGGKDISDDARESLLRMKAVGTTDRINVIAQFDSGSEGTSTKRYLLQPLENAIWIETLLRQACVAVPATSGPEKSAVGQYFYKRLVDALPENYPSPLGEDLDLRTKFQQKYPADQMIELLEYSPEQFKIFVLDFLLDPDLDNKRTKDGNQGDTNAGDPTVLTDFVERAIKKHPANNNMVIIWGHGNGLSVACDFPGSPVVGEGDPLKADELSKALKEAHDRIMQVVWKRFPKKKFPNKRAIDIVGFNSCSLGTIEVYYGLRKYVQFGIASEGFTPKTSWPYDKILKALDGNSGMEPRDFAQKIVEEYIAHYEGSVRATEERRKARRAFGIPLGASFDLNKGPDLASAKGPDLGIPNKGPDLGIPNKGPDLGIPVKGPDLGPQAEVERRGIDLSVCELKDSEDVKKSMAGLVGKLTDDKSGIAGNGSENRTVFGAVLAAHAVAQSYFNKDFTDLHDFCRALRIFCSDQGIKNACTNVMQNIRAMCRQPRYSGKDVENSKGVSIYFPWDDWDEKQSLSRYKRLDFPKKTEWGEFLEKYRDLVNDFEGRRLRPSPAPRKP